MSLSLKGIILYFLVKYKFVPNFIERRKAIREDHLRYIRSAFRRGEVIAGGAYGELEDIAGGLIVFKLDCRERADQFVRKDPFYVSGLITSYEIHEWHVVVGLQ